MERKIWENLSAADTLAKLDDPCPNAATTRAYYAAYQAVWSTLEERGAEVPETRPGVRYFRHDEVGYLAQDYWVFDRDLALLFEELREARVKADYLRDHCTRADALACIRSARRIVDELMGPGACDDQ